MSMGIPYGTPRQNRHDPLRSASQAPADDNEGSEDQPEIWNAPYEGPAPKLLFVAPDGDVYELDQGRLPSDFGDKAILGGLIGAVSQRMNEEWLRG